MTDVATFIDGNGIGGILEEIFAAEPTSAQRICQSCLTQHPAGEHRAYASAGIVLRCPHCGDLALRVARQPGRQLVDVRGTWIFDTAGEALSTGPEDHSDR